jgi:alkylresorcinol/alkylpyrone synthase
VAHPEIRLSQEEAAARLAARVSDERRIRAVARGTKIDGRYVVLPPDQISALGSIGERNAIYEKVAPGLAMQAVSGLALGCKDEISALVCSSCTGYMVPGWDVELVQRLGLRPGTARLPITQAGCAGGVVALARAADFLRVRRGRGLVVAAEVCSLAFHADPEEGNLTSALIFGDGAGALLLDATDGDAEALEIVDSASLLVPCSREVLGFALTDGGFYPQLGRELANFLPEPVREAVMALLKANDLRLHDAGFWLVHPGGPRILEAVQQSLDLRDDDLRWSWQSLREFGNTSSAAIFDVVRRYLDEAGAPAGWGIVMAFGPGVSIELLLVRRC